MCFCLFLIISVYRLFKSEWRTDEQLSICSWHGLVDCFGAIFSTAVLGTYCDLVGLLSVLVFRRKMYDNKDLRPFRACFLKTQVETFDFLFLNPSCLWEGLVELLLWILRNFFFFVNFSESFVPVGRTSGTVTVNIAKFCKFLRILRACGKD